MKIGDKVVCVDDSPCRCGDCGNYVFPWLKKGQIYVIEGMEAGTPPVAVLLWLIGELEDPLHHRGINAARFRLLDDLKREAGARANERRAMRTDLNPDEV